ncbi:MAG: hypothetical protein Fur0011_6870 [Candidatus Microgenomates bacterium]
MKKIILFGIVLIGVVIGAYYYFVPSKELTSGSPNPSAIVGGEAGQSQLAEVEKYSMAELSTHNNKEDCWLLLNGKIYDVTPYVESGFHPGKDSILMGCGKDATEIFNNRPNGSGSHSERARKMLSKYYKGELATE